MERKQKILNIRPTKGFTSDESANMINKQIREERKRFFGDVPEKNNSIEHVYIGIDNGVSGTIGIITKNESFFYITPAITQQNYTKKKANISRIDFNRLLSLLGKHSSQNTVVNCILERPMVNPGRFNATTSALRALEATLIVIEKLEFSYSYVDSKEWQKDLLPRGSAKEALKKDSLDIGCRLFPQHSELIKKHKDADGILMAEYCRRKFK